MAYDIILGRIPMFDDLLLQIDGRTAKSPIVTVGISGFAGAGKTHLSEKLAAHYKIQDGQIIHLDNLYAPTPRGHGLFDDYDWTTLTHILQSAKQGEGLDYRGVGFEGKPYGWRFKELLPKILIVEGIRLYRSGFMSNYDISVWVDCPPELALKRAKARDLQQGHDAAYMKRWDTEWGPQNKAYFDTYHPTELANFIYTEYGA